MSKRKVADDLWAMLADAGVTRCYGIVGDALNPTVQALARRSDIEFIHVRNEEWGTFAASADAYLTGKPVAVCGTAGPGITHLLNGLLDAYRERCPIIAIAGDVETSVMDLGVVEEINPRELFRTASLWTGRVVNPHQAHGIFAQAIRTAVIERGPTVIALPGDVANAHAPEKPHDFYLPQLPAPRPAQQDLDTIAALINEADKITIFGGDGTRDAVADVIALAERLRAPVGFSYKGKQYLEADNPYAVGMTGLIGYGGCFHALRTADLILMLGTDFPFPDFLQAGHAKLVQVDLSAQRLGRRVPLAAGTVADVGEFVRAILPMVETRTDDGHLDHARKISKRWDRRLKAYVDGGESRSPIRPEYVAATLNELMDDDAIVTADTGTSNIWSAHYIDFHDDRRFFGSLSWASMANASPNAFGAAKAYPGRQIVAMCGDGGFTMLALGDLITEVQHQARIVHVIFHNNALDFVEIEQQEAGLIPFGTGMPTPNLAAAATALGAKGIHVEDPKDVRPALVEALAHQDGPVVVDIVVDRSALSVPSHVPVETAAGFTLSMSKRVLHGDAGEVLQIAHRNYRLLTP